VRFITTVVSAALLLFIIYLIAGWIVDGYFGGNIVPNGAVPDSWAAPNSWSQWRDILIVFMAAFWMMAGLLTVVLIVVLILLALAARRVMRENVAPAVDSLKDSLDNIRGTTEFAGETVVSPIIRVYSVVRGVRSGVRAVGNLPSRIRGRKKGKK
jgi:hypothetical protein